MQATLAPEMKELLDLAISHKASDLHLTVGVPPVVRIDGRLSSVPDKSALTLESVTTLIRSFMTQEQLETLKIQKELLMFIGQILCGLSWSIKKTLCRGLSEGIGTF